MKLFEALQASQTGTAIAYLDEKIVAGADYAGFALYGNDFLPLSWSQALPRDLDYIEGLDWRPQNPKDPLTQLAETLSSWQDVEEEESNEQ